MNTYKEMEKRAEDSANAINSAMDNILYKAFKKPSKKEIIYNKQRHFDGISKPYFMTINLRCECDYKLNNK